MRARELGCSLAVGLTISTVVRAEELWRTSLVLEAAGARCAVFRQEFENWPRASIAGSSQGPISVGDSQHWLICASGRPRRLPSSWLAAATKQDATLRELEGAQFPRRACTRAWCFDLENGDHLTSTSGKEEQRLSSAIRADASTSSSVVAVGDSLITWAVVAGDRVSRWKPDGVGVESLALPRPPAIRGAE